MKLRRFLAVTAASALAVTALAAPASAQTDDFIDNAIANLDCNMLDTGLKTVNAYEADHTDNKTTHSELATNIRGLSQQNFGQLVGNLPGASLLQIQYSGAVADRALACELVAENPELPFGSSQLYDALPFLELLSSEAK
ncbi:hypothetical protein [Corynebacterium sp. A21]|uniref:hypothetical protein n=1 Tax=Corynebacterium sp. A21 TaxID=3457318 RepID=UPI003FCF210B